ncbi:MAG TPA: NADH-quinone oxidoreductase subunit NuoK [Bacteroidales bacterium]|jgi:NADH-quinone oxidoreductase subunit K|nr:NADH-quinone oxidoreductase subunit NuoK [Bacteroidales bacterium]HOX78411.1 NADH-quinone oxidoreductase subunit NuoK [Bacteroidales bacterium]HPI85603.1 NADH-quinone oxidoreductase subunit NuoK [Bacteroidales bacterium]HPM93810.1 NADH-quinone oxidoreductase subunit NuoK [Bacteroidales bacterium]
MIEGIPIVHFLIVTTIMFFVGVYGFLVRRNLITILMSLELMLNSVAINFVVFNKYLYPGHLQGHFFSLFIIAVAAAEAAVAIAIIINVYRRFNNINVEDVSNMKH